MIAGTPRERSDARAKVTGEARYSADVPVIEPLHAVLVVSTIARGRISAFDARETEATPGFVALLTYRNAPRLDGRVTGRPGVDKRLLLLESDRVECDRQPIAVVVGATFEAARDAAARLRVTYEAEPPIPTLADPRARAFPPDRTPHGEPADIARGDAAAARAEAPIVHDATYTTPTEHHNPMEPHASIAAWDGDRLTIWDATQGIFEERRKLASVFGLPESHVRVVSHYVGGGFGAKGSVWYHQALAAAAARHVGRPVKLVLARDHMFGATGHRPETVQRLVLGAGRDGILRSLEHEVWAHTSMVDAWMEASGEVSTMLYACENVTVRHRLARINVQTPTFMRAPGECTGTFALECAMDELAYAVGIDPLELRLRNYAERDGHRDVPFSSKKLRECYALGAERFGWERRDPRPRATRDGRELVGLGVATAVYPANQSNASATVVLRRDGTALVRSGTQEIGNGTYTVMAQLAAEELGLPLERVRFELGDTLFPYAPNCGGSWTVATVGTAVAQACRAVRAQLRALAGGDVAPADAALVLAAADREELSADSDARPAEERARFSCYSFGAQFAEVAVDPELGTVRVRRMLGVFDVGRVLNPRLVHSQLVGGMTMGIGAALLEQGRVDPRTARIVNASLGEYLVPVCADVVGLDALVVEGYDEHANPIGTKAVGELGICGAVAAIANAVYHATGRRVRDLPIGPHRLVA